MGNWARLPGRRFQNTKTGEIISRRQYDKQYGRLAEKGFSSNEAQAKANRIKDETEFHSKPARGRTSLRNKPLIEKQHLVQERKLKQKTRHYESPTVSTRLLKKGKKSATVKCDWSYIEINKIIYQINNFPPNIIFAYLIGAHVIDKDGLERDVSLWPFTFYNSEYSPDDWKTTNAILNNIGNRISGYGLKPLYGWVRISFDEIYYKAKNSKPPAKRKRRK
ncbi:MAG: hypothetical protein ACYC0J_10405 [Gammaproteobacteria bacterium]